MSLNHIVTENLTLTPTERLNLTVNNIDVLGIATVENVNIANNLFVFGDLEVGGNTELKSVTVDGDLKVNLDNTISFENGPKLKSLIGNDISMLQNDELKYADLFCGKINGYTFPTETTTAGYILSNNGTGTLSWTSPPIVGSYVPTASVSNGTLIGPGTIYYSAIPGSTNYFTISGFADVGTPTAGNAQIILSISPPTGYIFTNELNITGTGVPYSGNRGEGCLVSALAIRVSDTTVNMYFTSPSTGNWPGASTNCYVSYTGILLLSVTPLFGKVSNPGPERIFYE